MWNWLGILSSSFFLLLSPEVHTLRHNFYSTILDEKIACGQIDDIHYCLSRMNENPDRVVYFFPGILHNEYAWLYQRKNLKLRKILNEDRKSAPAVITISNGPLFIANQNDEEITQLLTSVFLDIENKAGLHPKERVFYGNSLGAFNAFEFSFWLSQNSNAKMTVQKLVLGCPLIPVQNPFADFDSQKTYFYNQEPHSFGFLARFLVMQSFFRLKFKDSQDWQNSSPLHLAYEKNLNSFPKTYLVGGKEDEFHFMDGAQKLDQILETKKVNHQLDLVDGSHCTVDLNKIAAFILN